jgi:nucleoside-diphosphate-sugar epimerase
VSPVRESILVTGATGFVGGALVRHLRHIGLPTVGAVRNGTLETGYVRSPDLTGSASWEHLLEPCKVIVHTAGRAHLPVNAPEAVAACHAINVDGTLNLARQAAAAGVKRFVFLSSVKVNGERTEQGRRFMADDLPAPEDIYGATKAEAEVGLRSLSEQTGMEVVIIRPPLVYGPGVKANFLSMMRWLKRGLPLPLGAVTGNRRSFVALDNLLDLIARCIEHPAVANETLLVSDGEDLSTAELLNRLACAMGVPTRLFPVPVGLLEASAAIVGKRAMMRRLCGTLQVDITKTQRLLDWSPPIDVDEGLRLAACLNP